MEEKIRKMLGVALGSTVMCLIVFGVFAVIALVGGNLMALFGFRYDGIGSLLLFFLLGAVVGLPLEVFSSAFPRALYAVGKISRWGAKALYNPLDSLFTMGSFWLIDQWMESVSATGLSLCIIGFCMSVATMPFKKEKAE